MTCLQFWCKFQDSGCCGRFEPSSSSGSEEGVAVGQRVVPRPSHLLQGVMIPLLCQQQSFGIFPPCCNVWVTQVRTVRVSSRTGQGVWVSGKVGLRDLFSAVIICIMEFLFLFFFLFLNRVHLCIFISLIDVALMFFPFLLFFTFFFFN